jgi:hypothetical protein
MKKIRLKLLVLTLTASGFFVGVVKGECARQKFMFKVRSRYDNRKQMAEKKSILKKGGILLDDIEMAAYHK